MIRRKGLLLLMFGVPFLCWATPTFFSGVDTGADLGGGGLMVLGPNSLSAYSAFQSVFAIGSVDTLESIGIPLMNGSLGFGITAACTNCDSTLLGVSPLSGVVNDPATWSELGYNTTGATTTTEALGQFYRVAAVKIGGSDNYNSSVLTLTFATPVTAFGAYVTGIQTSLGTTAVTFNDGAARSFPLLNSGTTINNPAGIQFFGFIDSNPVSSITFTTTNPTTDFRDIWGVDDIWVGEATPEPATLAMMGGGLLALGLLARRRG